jgi:Ubiquinol-cytochrome C reductase, UQCRX/QCR9 like
MVASKFSSKSDLNFTRIPIAFYENVWKKSNILYITYIVVGCVLIEVVYGSVTTAVWDGYNQGVRIRLLKLSSTSRVKNLSCYFFANLLFSKQLPLFFFVAWKNTEAGLQKINNLRIFINRPSQKLYKQIDWTKFKTEGEDDEEEE